MRKYIFYITTVIFCGTLLSCSQSDKNTNTSPSDSVTNEDTEQKDTQTVVQTGDDIVASVDGLMVREMYRDQQRVFGKYVEAPIGEIKETINKVVPDMMGQIQLKQLILSGTLLVIYPKENPGSKKAKLFIGIPVKIKKPVAGYEFMEFPAGDFYKATVNAAPGESTAHWNTFLKELDKKGYKYSQPYYEYYSDSRNAEMATVITQTSLLVKKN